LPWLPHDPTVTSVETTPAGWYPDPANPLQERLWDGTDWTESVRTPVPGPVPVTPSQPAPVGAGSTTGSLSLSLSILLLLGDIVLLATWRTRIESGSAVLPPALILLYAACALVGTALGLHSLLGSIRATDSRLYFRAVLGLVGNAIAALGVAAWLLGAPLMAPTLRAFPLVLLVVLSAVVVLGMHKGVPLLGNERAARIRPTATKEGAAANAEGAEERIVFPSGDPVASVSETTPAGWYVDPTNPLNERLWDGSAWIDRARPRAPVRETQALQARKPAKSHPVPKPNSTWWS